MTVNALVAAGAEFAVTHLVHRSDLEIAPIYRPPAAWPNGALVEPHHAQNPAPKLTLGSSVTVFQRKAFNPQPKKGAKK